MKSFFVFLYLVSVLFVLPASILDGAHPSRVMLNAGPDVTICNGDSTQLNAGGGTTYSWAPATGLSNPLISNPIAKPTVTTTYILFSANATGGIIRDTLVITVNPVNTLLMGNMRIMCSGDSILLTPVCSAIPPVLTYQWSPPAGLSSSFVINPKASPATTTLYTLTVISTNGCTVSDTLRVKVNQFTGTVMNDTAVCANDTVFLHAAGGISYQWLPSTNMINPTSPTTFVSTPFIDTLYQVVISDSLGCTDTLRVDVTVHTPPIANAGRDTAIYCKDTIQVFGSGGGTYMWFPSGFVLNPTQQNPFITPWWDTQYTLEVTDANGCQSYDQVNIDLIDHFMKVTIVDPAVSPKVICPGDTLQLQASVSHPVVSYNWYPPEANYSAPNSYITQASPPNSMTMGLYVVDSIQCKDLYNVDIIIDDFRIKTLDNLDACEGQTIFLETNGSNTFDYTWTPPTGLSGNQVPEPHLTASQTITYIVEAIDSLGCHSLDTVTITHHPLPSVDAGADLETCAGTPVSLNGSGTGSFSWSPNIALNDPNISNPSANPPVSTTYTLTTTSEWGCQNKDFMRLEVRGIPPLNSFSDVTICAGDSVQVTASGGNIYQWQPFFHISNPGISNPFLFPVVTTQYTVIASNDFGCSDTARFYVNVNPTPITKIEGVEGICFGQQTELVATGGGNQFLWSTGETTSSILVSPQSPTSYICTSMDSNTGCGNIPDTVTIAVWDNPIADFTYTINSPYVPVSIPFTNASTGGYTYTWNFGMPEQPEYSENPTHDFPRGGDFNVQLITTNTFGCKDTAIKKISLEYAHLYLPSAFTPNGDTDNINNLYYIQHTGIKEAHTEIFNRYGKIVFQSDDINFQWDGTANGQDVPEGVYMIQVEAKDTNGNLFKEVGSLTLIR